MLKTAAIQAFLQQTPYEIGKNYHPGMEVQVNVVPGEHVISGEYKGRPWSAYSDGSQTWKNFRIPHNSGSDPEYTDSNIKFDISEHAEAIGMTGWNFAAKRSHWVAFDFDSVIGHKQGLTEEELKELFAKVSGCPYVSVYTSTSGNGYHLYVFIETEDEIRNHNEHAAVAKAILGKVSALTGVDLFGKVDTLGGNIWVWHRNAKPEISYKCLKRATDLIKELPANWRTYVETKKFTPLVKRHMTDEDVLIAAQHTIALDEEHLKLIKWFEQSDSLWWWDATRHLLVCHTYDLKRAHQSLKLQGVFDTVSEGKLHGKDQNCFAFPLSEGAWIVRRHGKNTTESPTWFVDRSGWTTCYFNKRPNLRNAAAVTGGTEAESFFAFPSLAKAIEAAKLISPELQAECPLVYSERPAKLRQKGTKIILSFPKEETDKMVQGWVAHKKEWQLIFYVNNTDTQIELPDNIVRHITYEATELGWVLNTNNAWVGENKQNVVHALQTLDYTGEQIDTILGKCVMHNWKIVHLPFQPEYPGNRRWNRNAAQLKFFPEQGPHPSWNLILEHCGKCLDDAVKDLKSTEIKTGYDYLLAWIAASIQYPDQPLPYLFFTGPQNCGKSIFHEAIQLLFTGGIIRADTALLNPSGFNGELESAVICIIEETDLSKKTVAADRIKDWVTSPTIAIHAKYRQVYEVPNRTHWIQCANTLNYCPIFPGDTRIVVLKLDELASGTEISKSQLLLRCEREAAAFIYTLLNFTLPPVQGRLRIPCISTSAKEQQQDNTISIVQEFIDTKVYKIKGGFVKLSDLYEKFLGTLSLVEQQNWTQRRFGVELVNLGYPKGKYGAENQMHIGNISLRDCEEGRLIKFKDGRLVV